MYIILGFVLIVLLVTILVWCGNTTVHYHKFDLTEGMFAGVLAMLVSCAILLVITGITWLSSYDYYLDLKYFRDAGNDRHVESILAYKKAAVADMREEIGTVVTDLKLQGYQQEISKMIGTYRDAIDTYNLVLTKKRQRKSNPVFSWFIVSPDPDMELIKMNQSLLK
jgi:hypothetical protein